MSFLTVERFVVRLLHDPALLDEIRHNPERVLGLDTLNAEELGWLYNTDERALRADPHRPARALQALLEEFPVSAALAAPGVPEQLIVFFRSENFHRAIHTRQFLYEGFGDYLEQYGTGNAQIIVPLERAIGKARRTASTPGKPVPKGSMQTRPGVLPLCLEERALPLYQVLRSQLFDSSKGLIEALQAHTQHAMPKHLGGENWTLIEADENGNTALGTAPKALCQLLLRAQEPTPRSELLNRALELGAESPEEASELLEHLQDENLLC